MDVIRIQGGTPLTGSVKVSGAKNAALPIFAATLLTDEPCVLHNVPNLSDMRFMMQIMEHIGAKIERIDNNSWRITAKEIDPVAPYELVRKMRASVCLMGPLVARLKKAEVSLPGGCVIGQRPIDLHIKGLARLGCQVTIKNGYVHLDGSKLKGTRVFMGGRHGSTVTGTANLVMAAVLTPGITRIESAACEPEIDDLCHMLVKMGAQIAGIGSHTLTIKGVDKLSGCEHRVIPDRIEAGTFLIAAGITGGDILVEDAEAHHLGALLDKLEEAGMEISVFDELRIRAKAAPNGLKPIDIITLPYPGFPTDLQAQMCTLMTQCEGISIATDRIYPNRFMHVPEMQRMGADIAIENNSAIIKGPVPLSGAPVMASDLRASIALVLAAIVAEGESWIQRVYHIDRGYENIDEKLITLGANLERMSAEKMPKDLHHELTFA